MEVTLVLLEYDKHSFPEGFSVLFASSCSEVVALEFESSLLCMLPGCLEILQDFEVKEVRGDEQTQEQRVVFDGELGKPVLLVLHQKDKADEDYIVVDDPV